MSSSLRYQTALSSLLIILSLLGHSLYHALALDHHHHVKPHGHHHDHESETKQGFDKRDVIKCELFSIVPVAPQVGLVSQRHWYKGVYPEGKLWKNRPTYLAPNSRAPPILSPSLTSC